MDKLWAPWRIRYLTDKKKKGCIFCRAAGKKGNYIIFETAYSLCMLNIYPYNNGHLMVSPKRHVAAIERLKDKENADLMRAVIKAKMLLDRAIKPQGYNIGINISSAAGAGITGHLHAHIVPRWQGDTNFMPVIHNTKIISQSLDELYKILKEHADPKTNQALRR